MESLPGRLLIGPGIFRPFIFLPLHCRRLVAALVVLSLTITGAQANEPEQARKVPLLLDCAVGNGSDDAFALALAAVDPTIELLGVTTVGGDAEDRAWMVCRFLSAIGKGDIPVAYGRDNQPKSEIGPQFQYRYHPAVLYGRTARPVKQTAVELLHQVLTRSDVQVTIVCTGPLTNVARLFVEHPDAKERIERIVISGGRNLKSDVHAAKAVLGSKLRIDFVPFDAGVEFDDPFRRRLFDRCTPLTLQLQTLYELEPQLTLQVDVTAIGLASRDTSLREAFVIMPTRIRMGDDGEVQFVDAGSLTIPMVRSVNADVVRRWIEQRLSAGEPALSRELANRTRPIGRGGMPHRVHVFEDYETDIERRWWLAGLAAEDNVAEGGKRHCRGMLTMDFDDQQGDTKTMYRAVVFNPVPGPPMGKNPRLSFRCWLKGTDSLRVQIYSLSNGYHRYLSLADLPQEQWLDLAVDMTAARRPDGSGGPLSAGERIDDIQFYVEPRAEELRIDDIVLYDAAAGDENRPFPKRILFTGWFDTGKQGQEWPGEFEIPDDSGYFWKAARSIRKAGGQEIRINLRGHRPRGESVQVDFRYKTAVAGPLVVVLNDPVQGHNLRASIAELEPGDWQRASVTLSAPSGTVPASDERSASAAEVLFTFAGEDPLLVDDLLLYEPGSSR